MLEHLVTLVIRHDSGQDPAEWPWADLLTAQAVEVIATAALPPIRLNTPVATPARKAVVELGAETAAAGSAPAELAAAEPSAALEVLAAGPEMPDGPDQYPPDAASVISGAVDPTTGLSLPVADVPSAPGAPDEAALPSVVVELVEPQSAELPADTRANSADLTPVEAAYHAFDQLWTHICTASDEEGIEHMAALGNLPPGLILHRLGSFLDTAGTYPSPGDDATRAALIAQILALDPDTYAYPSP